MATVRYIVDDVAEAVDFYVSKLGFEVELQVPAFASLKRDDLTLWLGGPRSSAARPMLDGAVPVAGGWMSGTYSAERLGPSMRNPTVSEYSWRCGTAMGVTVMRSLSGIATPALMGSMVMLPSTINCSHGPFSERNASMRGIAYTVTPRAPITSRPR